MEFDIQERSKRCIGDTCHGILSLRIWMTHHESTERVSSCDLNFLPGRKTLHGLYCSDKVLRHLRLWNPHIPRFNSEPHQKESLAAMAWFFLLVLAAKSWAVRMVCINRPTYWVTIHAIHFEGLIVLTNPEESLAGYSHVAFQSKRWA